MDDDLVRFRDLARTFCAQELLPHQHRWARQQHVDRELWLTAGEVGLLGPAVPERYGGGGGTFAHEAVLVEEQARVGDTAWGLTAHLMAGHYIHEFGTEEQKAAWLPKLASGELVGSIAVTEPGAGSDVQAVATRAVLDREEYVLTGSKAFVTNGVQTDLAVMLVRTGDKLSLMLVPGDGMRRGSPLDKIGLKGQDTCELFLDDVRVPAANLLGGVPGRGLAQLMPLMSRERLLIAVTSVAAMETCVAATVAYTRQRTVFGKRLSRFQNTQFRLAECATEAEVCRAFVDRCVRRQLAGELDAAGAAMAKLWATERLWRVVDVCLQLFGGYGYLAEYPVAVAWTDARVRRIFGGTTEIMKQIIAATLR